MTKLRLLPFVLLAAASVVSCKKRTYQESPEAGSEASSVSVGSILTNGRVWVFPAMRMLPDPKQLETKTDALGKKVSVPKEVMTFCFYSSVTENDNQKEAFEKAKLKFRYPVSEYNLRINAFDNLVLIALPGDAPTTVIEKLTKDSAASDLAAKEGRAADYFSKDNAWSTNHKALVKIWDAGAKLQDKDFGECPEFHPNKDALLK